MMYQPLFLACELESLPVSASDNLMCARCPLYLNTCMPIAGRDGYALASECDRYLCEGCTSESCPYSPVWS